MKYLIYHSENDNCYTLVDEDNTRFHFLEADAKIVKTFEAASWELAVDIEAEFITSVDLS